MTKSTWEQIHCFSALFSSPSAERKLFALHSQSLQGKHHIARGKINCLFLPTSHFHVNVRMNFNSAAISSISDFKLNDTLLKLSCLLITICVTYMKRPISGLFLFLTQIFLTVSAWLCPFPFHLLSSYSLTSSCFFPIIHTLTVFTFIHFLSVPAVYLLFHCLIHAYSFLYLNYSPATFSSIFTPTSFLPSRLLASAYLSFFSCHFLGSSFI